MKRLNILITVYIALTLSVSAQSWMPDILGNGFEMRYVDQGQDYSGDVRCTIVRHQSPVPSKKGVLYIHGFNDYFFQKEMAEKFAAHAYNFYAVDLRKYGRSLMPGQKHFEIRNLKEYFPDVDSALVAMRHAGCDTIVLMGHSTGGLVSSYYMALTPQAPVCALILNSPFLDWNLGKLECLVNAVSALGKIFPDIPISSGSGTAYSESLLRGEHGEWNYNTDWKQRLSPKVNTGWIRAINMAQHDLRKHKDAIHVPILLMYSAHSLNTDNWIPDANHADVVLDVSDIKKYGRMLGPDITFLKVPGGIHDLMLSSQNVRTPLYTYIFKWLLKNKV